MSYSGRKGEYMKNKKIILCILGILLVFSILIGLSYAYWLTTNSQENSNIAKAGCFDTQFIENSDAIKLDSVYPISDSQGTKLTPFSFTIKNTCNYDANYQINLETLSSTLKLKNIRVKLSDNDSNLLTNFSTNTKVLESTDSRLLTSGTLNSGSSKTFELRVWLDKDTTLNDINNTMGADNSWEGKITVITALDSSLSNYKDNVIAQAPTLYQGLIPVKYDASGNVVVADLKEEWYDYKTHEWANAVLVNCSDSTIKSKYFNSDMSLKDDAVGKTIPMDEILQMYVWIPRYRYKLFNAENGTASEQAIEIKFESTSTAKSTGSKNGAWLTHPAFTFGSTELPGIWVGKFEASGTTDNYTIKPNEQSLTNINLSVMFSTSRSTSTDSISKYGLNKANVDTHMIKNIEWGAVSYLTNSIYGRYNDTSTCIASGCEVWINNINTGYGNGTAVDGQPQWGPSITGCAGASTSAGVSSSQTACASGYDWTTKGVNASTTGNQYGIYDMSGGAWEYVMGVQKDVNGNVQVGSSGFSAASFPDNKYYDLYDYQESAGVGYSRYRLGDATREVLKNTTAQGQYAWWNDWTSSIYSSNPWVGRGGTYNAVMGAGVFDFNDSLAGGATSASFHSVITAP